MNSEVTVSTLTQRRIGIWALLLFAVSAIAIGWLDLAPPITKGADADLFAAFCLPPPASALVSRDVVPDHIVRVVVPRETPSDPILDAGLHRPMKVRRGEVVEFQVTSGRKGALAVHGLSDLARIDAGDASVVRFRAIYTGRFPLHFHGVDGSHFEVAVIEIRDNP